MGAAPAKPFSNQTADDMSGGGSYEDDIPF
jgi:hypothetical protein